MKDMKKYPMHGKDAQLRIDSNGVAETENDVVEKEYKEIDNKKNKFKKILQAIDKKKK